MLSGFRMFKRQEEPERGEQIEHHINVGITIGGCTVGKLAVLNLPVGPLTKEEQERVAAVMVRELLFEVDQLARSPQAQADLSAWAKTVAANL